MSGNNAWFEQNCDPDDVVESAEPVASGGGPVGAPGGGAAPNTVNAVIEDLIGQCYGQLTPRKPNFKDDDDDDDDDTFEIDWSFILPELTGHGWPPPTIDKIRLTIPTTDNPGTPNICYGENGEEISCEHEKNPDLEDCIKEHLKCVFKPYVGGAWKPPGTRSNDITGRKSAPRGVPGTRGTLPVIALEEG